jgi:hypothetical protein
MKKIFKHSVPKNSSSEKRSLTKEHFDDSEEKNSLPDLMLPKKKFFFYGPFSTEMPARIIRT